MTPAQQARTEGFLASLSVRGVMLTLLPGEQPLTVLLERIEPDQGEFTVARETATGSRLHTLRTQIEDLEINVGSVLRDPAALVTYRVAAIDDNSANIAVVFTCEAAAEPKL